MTSARLRCGHLKILARIGGAALMLAIASGTPALARNPLKLPETQYEPVAWAMIDGWADDDHNAAFASFLNSCKAILQGPPSLWIEQLTELTLVHGVSGFILYRVESDDVIRTFAEEVAPAVRSSVSAERERQERLGSDRCQK